jgi:phosphonate transport system ATP-binding protein
MALAALDKDTPVQAVPVDLAGAAARVPHDLVIAGMSKRFGVSRPVLDRLDLQVPRGQALSIIGANGAGKSTLLRCCLRLIEPDSGDLQLLSHDVTRAKRRELRRLRARIGFVFQRHNLVPRLSALSNVLHGALARDGGPGCWYQAVAPERLRREAIACLERVGLPHVAAQRADQLSGGQSQRVAIARMLMHHPELVMADEPVASLDPIAGEEVMALLSDLMRDQGLTLVFTTHNLNHAVTYADRIVGLRRGRLELDAPSRGQRPVELEDIYG